MFNEKLVLAEFQSCSEFLTCKTKTNDTTKLSLLLIFGAFLAKPIHFLFLFSLQFSSYFIIVLLRRKISVCHYEF